MKPIFILFATLIAGCLLDHEPAPGRKRVITIICDDMVCGPQVLQPDGSYRQECVLADSCIQYPKAKPACPDPNLGEPVPCGPGSSDA